MWFSRLRPLLTPRARRQPRPRRSRWCRFLYLERLEDRVAPAAVQWINPGGGAWEVAGNWSTGAVPGGADNVTIPALSPGAAVTHATGNHAVQSLAGQGALVLSGGSLSVQSASMFDGDLTLDGGKLTGIGNITVNGRTTWDSGTITEQARGLTFTAAGGLSLGTGLKVLDQRALSAPGPLTWTGGDVVLQNGAAWNVPPDRPDLAPYAVLKVSGVTAPTLTVGERAPVTVSWTVTNTGTGPGVTGTWTDEIIATTDATLGNPAHEVVLDRVTHTSPTGGADNYTAQDTFNLPLVVSGDTANPLNGRYHLFVRADADDQVFMNEQRADAAAAAPGPFDVSPRPFADLAVTGVQAPPAAQTGQSLHVSWEVANQGAATTDKNGWNDSVSLATDPDGKNLVAQVKGFSFTHDGALAPNESYQRSGDVPLPQNLPDGTYYVVVETNSDRATYEFLSTGNNTAVSATPVQVTHGPGPHLVVEPAITVPDRQVAAGSTVDFSWTVRNDGTADITGTRTDQLSLVPVGGGVGGSLGSFQDSDPLQAGKFVTRTAHVTLPAGAQGLYRLSVTAIGPGVSATAVSDGTFRIDPAPTPDLEVTSLTAPATVHAGQDMAVDFTVANLGGGVTGSSWNDNLYLSLSNDINGAQLVASLPNQVALLPGESYQVHTPAFTVPKDYGGPAYLIARADSGTTFSQAINVIPIAPADLVVSDVEAPDQGFTNSTIKVTWKVTNRGLGPTDVTGWTDRIWLSHAVTRPDTSPPRNDVILGNVQHQGVLQVGDSYTGEAEVTLSAPVSGEYFVTVQADVGGAVVKQMLDANVNPDDPHELNSDGYKARPITVLGSRGVPDLAVTSVVPQAQAVGGDPFTVKWTVVNQGTSPTIFSWPVSVYLSTSPTLFAPGSQQTLLSFTNYFDLLAPGAGKTVEQTYSLPLTASGQYVIVTVSSPEDPYPGNNTASGPTNVTPRAPANLHVSNTRVTPGTSPSGESITVNWTVTNDGADAWAGNQDWADEVFLSPDPVFYSNRATSIGFATHFNSPPLKAGQSYPESLTANLPPGIQGTYYLYVTAGAGGFVYQLDPGDVRKHMDSTSLQVVYREPALQISGLSAPLTASAGQKIPVSWTVTNVGSRATRQSFWFDTVYLSRDPSLSPYSDPSQDPSAVVLNSYEYGKPLASDPGKNSYQGNLSVTLPQGIQGDFYVVVYTDAVSLPFPNSGDIIPEFGGEGHHIQAVPIHIAPAPLPVVQVSGVTVPERVTAGQAFTVSYTVTNNSPAATSQFFWPDTIYLSPNPVFDQQHAIPLSVAPGSVQPQSPFGGLPAQGSYHNTVSVVAPDNLSGPFYVIVRTGGLTYLPAAPATLTYFVATRNDSAASARPLLIDPLPPPELQVESVSVAQIRANVGNTLDITWAVSNPSGGVANSPWSDAVYLSTKPVWDADARLLGQVNFPGVTRPGFFFPSTDLRPGESYTSTGHFTLPVVAPGFYYVLVLPDAHNQVSAAPDKRNDQGASADAVQVSARPLVPGVPQAVAAGGGEQLFRIDAPAGQTLRVSLNAGNGAAAEVLVRAGDVPSDEAFDVTSFGTPAEAPFALIPTTTEGPYYVLLRGTFAAGATPTLLAEFLPLGITDVSTDAGGDGRYVTTTIRGAAFRPGAIVKLVRPDFAEFEPVSYRVVDGTTIVATFDLRTAPHGLYDVEVINPDGAEAVVPYRYEVQPATAPDVEVGLGGPHVLNPGDTGTYTVSVHSDTNLDTPYVYFQFGQSSGGPAGVSNPDVFNFRYVDFASNLGGSPDDPALHGVPWADLGTTVTTGGQNLAPGYVYDFATQGTVPFTFTATVYPGWKALSKVTSTSDFGQLRDDLYAHYPQLVGKLEAGPGGLSALSPQLLAAYQELVGTDPNRDPLADLDPPDVSFTFQVTVSATVLTREEFVQRQTDEAEALRLAVLNDPTASPGLLALAADHDTWVNGFLAALEQAGLLRPDNTAPPVHEDPKVVSLIATLASGVLAGPAGQQIITNGDLVSFFSQVRKWYGNPPLPDNLNLSHATHTERLNVYVPFDDDNDDFDNDNAHPEVLPGKSPPPNFQRFQAGPGAQDPQAVLTGPQGSGSSVPSDQALPYTVHFGNPSAAALGEVRVVMHLDPNLDPRLFQLGDMQIGDIQVHVPGGVSFFQQDFDYTASRGFILRVSGGLDSQPAAGGQTSNTVSYLFQAIDPATGQVLHDPAHGLLSAAGGFVSYKIRPKPGLKTGTAVTATARVLFDFGTPAAQVFDTATLTDTIDTGLNGRGLNLGTLPTLTQTPETPTPPPPPPPPLTTNPLFTQAQQNHPAAPAVARPSEFGSVLQPFRAESFATGIPPSQAGIGPVAIVTFPDGSALVSGGPTRGQLYHFSVEGGAAPAPLASLPYPIFDMALDGKGSLWATTGGGPLLRLDPATGAILGTFGDGLTLGLAVQPGTGLIYVASDRGVEIFDPVVQTFRHYSDVRVEDLAFAPDGSLWGTSWPDRGDVVRFDDPAHPTIILHFNDEVDSLAFGQNGTALQNLLFVTHNDGSTAGGGSVLTMVDLASVGKAKVAAVSVATGGSRGDVVKTTADGRVLLSQSHQVDVLSPIVPPRVAHTNPPPDALAALPLDAITVTFDSDMLQGDPADPHSVLDPANYQLQGDHVGTVPVRAVGYDPATRTAALAFAALAPAHYQLRVLASVESSDGLGLAQPYVGSFTAVADLTALVGLNFFDSRSDRTDGTVSYDVTVTNRTDRDLLLPLILQLDPALHYDGVPLGAAGRSASGAWLIDLSASLPNGLLHPGQATVGHTVTVLNPGDRRVAFDPSVSAVPAPVAPPAFTSLPPDAAAAGQPYSYQAAALDPQGEALSYLLTLAPVGMTVDPATGLVTWTPGEAAPAQAGVVLQVYDAFGAHSQQAFTVHVAGVNPEPAFDPIPAQVEGTEGQPLTLSVSATDEDGDPLAYWVEGLPPGASFDPGTQTLNWTPGPRAAGTYEVHFVVSDGPHQVVAPTTLLVAPGDLAPTLARPLDRTVQEGNAVRIALDASDPDGLPLTFSSDTLPGGAALDPHTGLFTWTPSAAGVYPVPFTVSNGKTSTTQTTTITVLHADMPPVFNPLGPFQVEQGHPLSFRAFAFDPHNPDFAPPNRRLDGSLTPLQGSPPSVTYTATGLPKGAAFDPDTDLFRWRPGFDTPPGVYPVTFTATVPGTGAGPGPSAAVTVPITVLRRNMPPVLDSLHDVTLNAGQTLEVPVRAADADGDSLTLAAGGSNGYSLPGFATFLDHHDGTGLLRFTPGPAAAGTYAITVTAGDGSLTDREVFYLTVNAANRPPHLVPVGDQVALVGQPLAFTVRAADPDQDGLTFALGGLPAGATLTPDAHTYGVAHFTWTPTAADLGTYAATLTVTDDGNGDPAHALSDQETIRVAVRTSNAAPVLAPVGDQSVAAGQTLTVPLSALDPDGDPVRYSAANLPPGATLDPVTGVLSWKPAPEQAGNYPNVVLTATDGNLSASQTIRIVVTPAAQAPVLQSLPAQSLREGDSLGLTLVAADPDHDALRFSAVTPLPPGAGLDPFTGRFRWTPAPGQAGDYLFGFRVQDPGGLADTADLAVHVAHVNHPPALQVTDHTAVVGGSLHFVVQGSDPDPGDTMTYSATGLPAGATLDPHSGAFDWTPGPGQQGHYTVRFSVSDGQLTASRTALVRAALTPEAPRVHVELTPSFPAVPGQAVTVHVVASSLADIAGIQATVDGRPLALDPDGRATITAGAPGRMLVEATATDADGLVGQASGVLKVRDPGNQSAPAVALDAGLAGARLGAATAVTGTVTGSNLDSWLLEWASPDTGTFTRLASGTAPVAGGRLAVFDPAAVANGPYLLRLTAVDFDGQSVSTQVEVEADTAAKPNQYQRTETDLTAQLGGTTVNLVRAYDSLAEGRDGSFGFGWRLVNRDTLLQTDVPGTGREVLGVYNPLRDGTRVFLTLPDGRRVGFTFRPQEHDQTGVTWYTPAWQADAGNDYRLTSADAVLLRAGDRFYDLTTGRPYNPADATFGGPAYVLTAPDGTAYDLDAAGRVVEQVTPGGGHLFFSDSGITADNGDAIQFQHDARGRLTQVMGPDGSEVLYGYDADGNLTSVRQLAPGDLTRYGYTGDTAHQLTLVLRPAGEASTGITYGPAPQTFALAADLGSASQFLTSDQAGSLGSGGTDRYALAFRPGEVGSAEAGSVLLGVEVTAAAGSTFQPGVPAIAGLKPLVRRTGAGTAFALFDIDREGLRLLEVAGADAATSGAYTLHLFVGGDVNNDGAVDGTDSGLLAQALGTRAGQPGYVPGADADRDGVVDAADAEILAADFGFAVNQAPVVTADPVLTHQDLPLAVDLTTLASDAENDPVYYRVAGAHHGTAVLAPDGQSVLFTPDPGYTGPADIELAYDEGFARFAPVTLPVDVSAAPLLNLDFTARNPRLDPGDQAALSVTGDFVDEPGVALPASYVTFRSTDPSVATVSADGVVDAVRQGSAAVVVSHNGIQAATAVAVGTPTDPTDKALLTSGLVVYPGAVTLSSQGGTRQFLAGADNTYGLSAASTGTLYFVGNPGVAQITPDGLATAVGEGVTEVTVIHGPAEQVVPVKVEAPQPGPVAVGSEGGVVQGADGSLVAVAPGVLPDNPDGTPPTTVSIAPLAENSLPMAMPPGFSFAGGFQLDVGDATLSQPVQLAIPVSPSLAPGTHVLFFRAGKLLNEAGAWVPGWLEVESGVVGTDGFAHTSSPPYSGVAVSGTYVAGAPDGQVSMIGAHLQVTVPLGVNGGMELAAIGGGAALGIIGAINSGILLTFTTALPKFVVATIPEEGLPTVQTVHAQIDPGKVTTLDVTIDNSQQANDPSRPVIDSASFQYTADNGPTVLLKGRNFTYDNPGAPPDRQVGSQLDDITVNFQVPYQSDPIPADLLPDSTPTALHFKVPTDVILGLAQISVTRPQYVPGPNGNWDDLVQKTSDPVSLDVPSQYVFAPLGLGQGLAVINGAPTVQGPGGTFVPNPNYNQMVARLTLDPTEPDKAGTRWAAVTPDGTRTYVTLPDAGGVSVVDAMALQEVDATTRVTVYHGTDWASAVAIANVASNPPRGGIQRNLLAGGDFGKGFYTWYDDPAVKSGKWALPLAKERGKQKVGPGQNYGVVVFEVPATQFTPVQIGPKSRPPTGQDQTAYRNAQKTWLDTILQLGRDGPPKYGTNPDTGTTGWYHPRKRSPAVPKQPIIEAPVYVSIRGSPGNPPADATFMPWVKPDSDQNRTDRTRYFPQQVVWAGAGIDTLNSSDVIRSATKYDPSGRPIETIRQQTPPVAHINLPAGALPFAEGVDPTGHYLFVGDELQPDVYVIDIDPTSPTFDEYVQTITLRDAPSGVRGLDVSADGKRLYVAAPGSTLFQSQVAVNGVQEENVPGNILVIDTDPKDDQFLQQIAEVPAGIPSPNGSVVGGMEPYGVTASSDPNVITFTDRLSNSTGFGVIRVKDSSPGKFAADVSFVQTPISTGGAGSRTIDAGFALGSLQGNFGVNNASAIALLPGGQYAFVTAFDRYIPDLLSHDPNAGDYNSADYEPAGGNVAIIQNPLGQGGQPPTVVAATRMIPDSFPDNLVLSEDAKVLYAGYRGSGAVFAFDVGEILKTLKDPNKVSELPFVPIDDLDPAIDVRANFALARQPGSSLPALKTTTTTGGDIFTYPYFETPAGATNGPIGTGSLPGGLAAQKDGLKVTAKYNENVTPALHRFGTYLSGVDLVNTFTVKAPDYVSAVEYRFDGGTLAQARRQGADTWTFDVDVGNFTDGQHLLDVLGLDAAGVQVSTYVGTLDEQDKLQYDLTVKFTGTSKPLVAEAVRFISGIPIDTTYTATLADLPLPDVYRNYLQLSFGPNNPIPLNSSTITYKRLDGRHGATFTFAFDTSALRDKADTFVAPQAGSATALSATHQLLVTQLPDWLTAPPPGVSAASARTYDPTKRAYVIDAFVPKQLSIEHVTSGTPFGLFDGLRSEATFGAVIRVTAPLEVARPVRATPEKVILRLIVLDQQILNKEFPVPAVSVGNFKVMLEGKLDPKTLLPIGAGVEIVYRIDLLSLLNDNERLKILDLNFKKVEVANVPIKGFHFRVFLSGDLQLDLIKMTLEVGGHLLLVGKTVKLWDDGPRVNVPWPIDDGSYVRLFEEFQAKGTVNVDGDVAFLNFIKLAGVTLSGTLLADLQLNLQANFAGDLVGDAGPAPLVTFDDAWGVLGLAYLLKATGTIFGLKVFSGSYGPNALNKGVAYAIFGNPPAVYVDTSPLLLRAAGAGGAPPPFFPGGGAWTGPVPGNSPNADQVQAAAAAALGEALNLWEQDLSLTSAPAISVEVEDLPPGELGYASVTRTDANGEPVAGTIVLDAGGAGAGWFLGVPPADPSGFSAAAGGTALQAVPGSGAAGRYDLFTAVLHEVGHLLGFTDTFPGFAAHVVTTASGAALFAGPGFTAPLTPDREELDSVLVPDDLMDATLAPSTRKLPSPLDVRILRAARATAADPAGGAPPHPLLLAPGGGQSSAAPPVGIVNGDFTVTDPADPHFGWTVRGAGTVAGGAGLLNEDNQVFTGFSQTFVVPAGAKSLEFTLSRTLFAGNGSLDPPDAFEAALLDAATGAPLVGTAAGLTNTDSFLNVQQNGQAFFSPRVQVSGASGSGQSLSLNAPVTVTVDLSGVRPGTQATLYFDLLGFGPATSSLALTDVNLGQGPLQSGGGGDGTNTGGSGGTTTTGGGAGSLITAALLASSGASGVSQEAGGPAGETFTPQSSAASTAVAVPLPAAAPASGGSSGVVAPATPAAVSSVLGVPGAFSSQVFLAEGETAGLPRLLLTFAHRFPGENPPPDQGGDDEPEQGDDNPDEFWLWPQEERPAAPPMRGPAADGEPVASAPTANRPAPQGPTPARERAVDALFCRAARDEGSTAPQPGEGAGAADCFWGLAGALALLPGSRTWRRREKGGRKPHLRPSPAQRQGRPE